MEYEVIISPSAKSDIDEILTYIMGELDNVSAATRLADEVDEKIELLTRQPKMFSSSLDSRLAEKGYRRVVIQNYVMLYRIDEDAKQVLVARLFYGKREYEKYL
jgi:addiction module RelE/StbE family toxin